MAASPSTVLTRGLGSWGSANLMITLGFGTAQEQPPDRAGFQYTLPRNVADYTLKPQQQFQLRRPA